MSSAATVPPLALVTGAARRLGRAIAIGLARQGYAIGLHYYHSDRDAQETAALIHSQGYDVQLYKADLRDLDSVEAMFEHIAHQPNPLKVLVNSAGVMLTGGLRDLPASSWDETMALNLRAPWLCSQHAARLMDTSGGVIINISDSGAGKNWTKYPAYVISKNGVEVLTRLLARSLAPRIRVNAVSPGLVLPPEDMPAVEWQRLVNRLPVQRAGDPANIVDTVLFLIENEDVTGQVIAVDGGYQLL